MASPTLEYLRSPFGNVFQSLPQGHDKAIKQACYNTAATLFAVVVCCGAVAVYHILEAFLRPLLWAVLCGTFLHPFKNTLTTVVQGWLKGLRTSGTPLAVGTALIPIRVLDKLSGMLGCIISSHLKLILGAGACLTATYLLYYFGPLQQILVICQTVFYFVYDALGYFSAIWCQYQFVLVWTLVVAYVLVVIFYWTPQSSRFLRHLAVPVWVAILFHFATIAGPLRVPIVVATVIFMIIGFVAELNETSKKRAEEVARDELLSPSVLATTTAWRVWSSANTSQSEPPSMESSLSESQRSLSPTDQSQSPSQSEASPASQSEGCSFVSEGATELQEDTPTTAPTEEPGPTPRTGKGRDETDLSRPQKLDIKGAMETSVDNEVKKPRTLSEHCFIGLFWAMLLVHLWKNFWIIQLLPILLLVLLIKRFGAHLGSWQWLRNKASSLAETCKTKVFTDQRMDILAPKPVRGLGKLILRGDRKIVASLENSMDKAISVLIILILMVGVVLLTFFFAVQVHRESMHLVSVTSNVLNNSLHPELSQWLPDSDAMQKTLDTMVNNAYLYGREWLATKITNVLGLGQSQGSINGAFNGNQANMTEVETQVLEVWDQLYENYFARNLTVQAGSMVLKGQPSSSLTNWTNVMDIVQNADFSLNIVAFMKENIGIVRQVLESVWLVLKGNINLVLNLLTATLSVLFGGGTALLNFLLSMIVFFTALFYLLASSGSQYKPVEWFSSLSPGQGTGGNKFGTAVEEAIGSVFAASLKMAAFYGLYSWLIHTVFGINIVFIPSALAAVFAMIPFMGTYWSALPAIIELWLVKGDSVQAVMLLVAHLLPTYFVDTAIYSDIKGGHPYLTGLAIAGGIYWMGLEGAIIAPILLCCLIAGFNVYSTMLKPDTGGPSADSPEGAEDREVPACETVGWREESSLPEQVFQ